LSRWLEIVKPNLAGKTFERYREIVEKDIKPALGKFLLSKLRPMEIQAFYSKALESGRLPMRLKMKTDRHHRRRKRTRNAV